MRLLATAHAAPAPGTAAALGGPGPAGLGAVFAQVALHLPLRRLGRAGAATRLAA